MPSAEAIAEMNKLRSDRVLVWLYEIQLNVDTTENRWALLTAHDEDFVFEGRTYTAYPIKHDRVTGNSAGDLGQTQIAVANIHGLAAQYLRDHGGLCGNRVVVRLLSAKTGTDPIELSNFESEIQSPTATNATVGLPVGQIPLRNLKFPLGRLVRNRCRYRWFRGELCGWTTAQAGNPSFCDRTLDGPDGCAAHENTARFGGQPALPGQR